MALSDDDFFMSDGEDQIMQEVLVRNPVEEHLLEQRREVVERVEKAKSNVAEVKELTESILTKLHVKATHGESSGSDSDSNLYQVTGEPVIKKKRTRVPLALPPLKIVETWQKVIDDKWIVGIVLEKTSNRTLEEPCLYVFVKNENELRGMTSFWKLMDDSLWTRTEELGSNSTIHVATCALDLPSFKNVEYFEAYGTVAYLLNGKSYQTVVPTFRLNANEAIDRSLAPRFNTDSENSILAVKALSVEHTISISMEQDPGRGEKFLKFLDDMSIKELKEYQDVYVSTNQESFRHCVFEILPCMTTEVMVRISAPSENRLNIIVSMLRDEFPDMSVPDPATRLMEAAIALERELELELAGVDAGGIYMARITTDLLIP